MKKNKCTKLLAFVLTVSLTGCGTLSESAAPSASETFNAPQIADIANKDRFGATDSFSLGESSYIDTIGYGSICEDAADIERENNEASDVQKSLEHELSAGEPGNIEAESAGENEETEAEQRNSFSMMYYLAITAEEIRASKDNRLALEDIYTSLLNDINPGAVDEITQDHLKNLRDIIKSYLSIATKRERLLFRYNQEKASAMRSAVPNPLAVLSMSNAMNWKNFALAVAYTTVDTYNNYKNTGESADLAYIMSGWELDDEEKDAIMKNRDRAFDYMVDMVQEYDLDGLKTLNEKAIEKFAEICATENAIERIRLLRAEEDTYSLLGNYWLELADSYFETSQYSKCLDCIGKYENLATGIYRKDYNYLQLLPKAIVAAQSVYSGDEYEKNIVEYADAIIINTSTDDWSMRYFAAQVYLDLYARTNNRAYLEKAYDIAADNVTVLLKDQRKLNTTYLADIVEQTAVEPDYRYMTEKEENDAKREYKDEKKRVKDYNKALEEKRKTELPSLYEPLVVNCELLFALADKMKIGGEEKNEIDAILETNTNGIFLVQPVNQAYSFSDCDVINGIEVEKNEIVIPVSLLTAGSSITATVHDDSGTITIDDCVVTKVKREGSTINTFKAYVSSKKMKKYDWTADSEITITITYGDAYDKTVSFNFVVSKFEKHWYGDAVEFEAK